MCSAAFDTTIEMNGKNCFMLRPTADGEMVGAWCRTGRLGDSVLDIGVGPIAGTRTYPTFMAFPVDMQSIWDGNTPLRSRWMWNIFFCTYVSTLFLNYIKLYNFSLYQFNRILGQVLDKCIHKTFFNIEANGWQM